MMRRWIPKTLLAAMTVLALVSVVLSLHTAERISTFSTPAPGQPAIVKIFRTVVQRTLDAPSFSYDQTLNYQAPDRVKGTGTYNGIIVVGSDVYLELSTTTSSSQWGKTPLTSLVDKEVGPVLVTQMLKTLLSLDSVVRVGNNFVAKQVVSADSIYPGNPGQVLITFMIYVSDDYVTSVTPRLNGWMSVPKSGTGGRIEWQRISKYQSMTLTYGNFGNIAPVTAPPVSRTAVLHECTGSSGIVFANQRLCLPTG